MKRHTETQPRIWQTVYKFYSENSSLSKDEFMKGATDLLTKNGFSAQWAQNTAYLFYDIMQKSAQNPDFPQEMGVEEGLLSLLDFSFLRESFKTEESEEVKHLLVAFAAYARVYPHKSNWIHYDRQAIIYLAGLSKLKVADQQSFINQLHVKYQLNMQVVGSAQPIPCFKIM